MKSKQEYIEDIEYFLAKNFGWTLDYIRNELTKKDIDMLISGWNKEQRRSQRDAKRNKRRRR